MSLGWKLLVVLDMLLSIITFLMMTQLAIAFYRYSKIMADPKMFKERQELIDNLTKQKVR